AKKMAGTRVPKAAQLARQRKEQRSHDPRRWTSTLATPVPPGPAGQPAHEPGALISVVDLARLPGKGNVSMPVPRASVLLLRQAEKHLRRPQKLRGQLGAQVVSRQWTQPGFEQTFSNEELLFDFFEEAMSGIVLAHAALDNFANESLPSEFVFTDEKGKMWTREDIERRMALEKRLRAVLNSATGRPSVALAKPDLFERAMAIKDLRD